MVHHTAKQCLPVIVIRVIYKVIGDGAFFSQLMQMKEGYTDGHTGEWFTRWLYKLLLQCGCVKKGNTK